SAIFSLMMGIYSHNGYIVNGYIRGCYILEPHIRTGSHSKKLPSSVTRAVSGSLRKRIKDRELRIAVPSDPASWILDPSCGFLLTDGGEAWKKVFRKTRSWILRR